MMLPKDLKTIPPDTSGEEWEIPKPASQEKKMHTQELQDQLESSLRLLLDQVDYTKGACGLTEMIGAALPAQVIDRCRATLKLVDAARAAAK